MSDSFMMHNSSPSIFTSVPDHFPNSTLSPTLRSNGVTLPSSLLLPDPAAIISPSWGFSWAVSGMIIPPAVFSSLSSLLTNTL